MKNNLCKTIVKKHQNKLHAHVCTGPVYLEPPFSLNLKQGIWKTKREREKEQKRNQPSKHQNLIGPVFGAYYTQLHRELDYNPPRKTVPTNILFFTLYT